jgi:transketolase
MPCWELFEEQDEHYKNAILPPLTTKRLAVEAASSFGWCKFLGNEGKMISIERFGVSSPGPVAMEKFGYTVDNVVAEAKKLLG